MIILGIETSCDETAAAVLTNENGRINILSNVVASSASLQAKYGGIIPEQAAREQIKSIIPVIEESLQASGIRQQDLDAIAVTYGPGLIGSLLVGVETAKTLAIVWDKPLIPVNHLLGHFYANWISISVSQYISESVDTPIYRSTDIPKFPCLGLLVSGGHTDLVLFTDHGEYKYLGGTRDDAAGECFDKCARLLGLPYPGGPQISRLAQKGDPNKFKLPVPMKGKKGLDFSYSGLKTAVSNIVNSSPVILNEVKNLLRMQDSNELRDPSLITQDDNILADLAASIEKTIIISLIDKLVLASKIYNVEQIMIAGGVAANQRLSEQLIKNFPRQAILIPPPNLCADNGAMIAAAGFFTKPLINPLKLEANPNLALSA